MITLKHVSGPLNGQEAQFGDDRDRIVVGRDPALCDVVFPPDYTIVGREHFAFLREVSGDYAIEPFGGHYVDVDGLPADPQVQLPPTATIRLGGPEGPSFKVTVDHSKTSSTLLPTQDQKKVVPERLLAGRARQFALGGAALAAAVAIGLGVVAYQANAERERQQALADGLSQQVIALNAREKASAGERISVADRARLSRSVYAVIVQDSSGREDLLGTAWAVRPNLLATNSHVAADFKALKPGEAMKVRPSGAGDYRYFIDSVQMHPGFDGFQAYLQSDPFMVAAKGGSRPFDDHVPGYDVALMHVKTALPNENILQIEDPDVVAKLAPGDAVALAGYPYENMQGDSVQPLGRTPQIQVGNVTSLSDVFLLPADPAQRHIVQVNLPITGGASGSPVIDSNGKVIALASAGNLFSLGGMRVPNAALVNYAQRVDVLNDLLAGTADAHLQADHAYWTKQTATFKRGVDVILPLILDATKPGPSSRATLAGEYKSSATAGTVTTNTDPDGTKSSMRIRFFSASLRASSQHVFVAYAQKSAPVPLMAVVANGKILVKREVTDKQYNFVTYTAPPGGQSIEIAVATPDDDTTYLVRDYVWDGAPS